MINYLRIGKAMKFYEMMGFKYVELPWAVDAQYSVITKPTSSNDFNLDDKVLVASGEQSFLELTHTGQLPLGKYYGITPCFRDDIENETHQRYFMKLELFQTVDVSERELESMLGWAELFLGTFLLIKRVKTDEGFDIESTRTGIELGSYGIREYNGIPWIYGTGLAEPRLGIAIQKNNEIRRTENIDNETGLQEIRTIK